MSHDYELELLAPPHRTKTIDFGAGGTSSSLSTHGRFLSIAAFHPEHGQVIAEPWRQFDATGHSDQSVVRKYRARAIDVHNDEGAGFGLSLSVHRAGGSTQRLEPRSWHFLNGSWPRIRLGSESCHASMTFFVEGGEGGRVVQRVELDNISDNDIVVNADFSGDYSVNRAAYTQLTPKGDVTIPDPKNVISQNERGDLIIDNPNLPARLQLSIEDEAGDWKAELPTETKTTGTVAVSLSTFVALPARSRKTFSVGLALGKVDPKDISPPTHDVQFPATITSLIDRAALTRLLDDDEKLSFIVLRNLDYLLSCCTMPVKGCDHTSKGTCIITDHQCLPLGWNRDNYWQLDMLAAILSHADTIIPEQYRSTVTSSLVDTIGSHLEWVFRTAERPDGHWGRSYFATGKPKDNVFQLDQQCYPLLELAQFACRNPGQIDLVRRLSENTVDELLKCLNTHHRWQGDGDECHEKLWLFTTDETPADDDVAYPYHCSSHLLLWHTLNELATLRKTLGEKVIRTDVGYWAEKVRSDTLNYFTVEDEKHGRLLAYEVDTTGQYRLYHDANDLPTVLAPQWGFCSASDPVWKNTIRFAFSDANPEGWYAGGKFGGMGSTHTPDPWPLGHAQGLWVNHYEEGLVERSEDLLEKLKSEVQWEGMFSEAIDRETGEVTSKSWFSWPGSFFSSTLLWQRAKAVHGRESF